MKPRLLLSKDKFKIDINNPMYWTPKKILSYDPYLATVEGGRGIGKTTNMLGYVLNDYCNNQSRFVYIRRYKPEIKQFVDPSKAPLNVIVDGVKYVGDKNGGYTCMYGDDALGYAIPLSTSKSYKSSKFKNVKWIIFDEYTLQRSSTYRYLTDEVITFMELISTIVRTDTDYRIILMGNNLDMFNPYYQFFNIPLFENIYYDKEHNIVCERPKNSPQLIEAEKKTPLYTILKGTAYADYHYDNKLLVNSQGKIENKPRDCRIFIKIRINKETLYVNMYNDVKSKELKLFIEVSNKVVKDDNITYTLLEDGKNNLYYINLFRKRFSMFLQRLYGTNKVSYSNQRACVLFNFIMEEF